MLYVLSYDVMEVRGPAVAKHAQLLKTAINLSIVL